MQKKDIFFGFIFTLLLHVGILSAQSTLKPLHVDDTVATFEVTIPLKEGEGIYKDYINFSIDNPAITLTAWKCASNPITEYDTAFKSDKTMYKNSVTLTVQATKNEPWTDADCSNVHVSYYKTSNKSMTEDIHPLQPIQKKPEIAYALDVQESDIQETSSAVQEPATAAQNESPAESTNFADSLSLRIKNSSSLWLQILLVFLLGILFSLTPCIYPMIPITVGILQASGSTSLLRNFAISLTYVTGIATTFAGLGLLAAGTGQVFGAFMSNPLVILMLVALLIYFALSMLGLYEMYIPKSLQQNKTTVQNGSLFSIFIFGLVSGSVASPCLSPGLVLLLSIVTSLSSAFLGFSLLFAFGLGLGLPLLIIGTFSSSINMLPRAGMWMVEVKKLTGLLLLGMCFYFLKAIVPLAYLLPAFALFLLLIGVALFYDAHKTMSVTWKWIKNGAGIICIASSVVVAAYTYKTITACPTLEEDASLWLFDYAQAHATAVREQKLLFVDIGAPFCSMCTAIDKTVLRNVCVLEALSKVVAVKVDGSKTDDTHIANLIKEYSVLGFPTFLLIDPTTGALLRQWGSELYDKPYNQFITELMEYV
jgi:thiol:disulfide interchange protein DsbD